MATTIPPSNDHPREADGSVIVALTIDQLTSLSDALGGATRRIYRLLDDCDGDLRRGLTRAADDLTRISLALGRRLPPHAPETPASVFSTPSTQTTRSQ